MLKNLLHQGACGCEENTGDGVGILIQKPDWFFRRVCAEIGIDLPAQDSYGAGLVFLPINPGEAQYCRDALADIIQEVLQASPLALILSSSAKAKRSVMPAI